LKLASGGSVAGRSGDLLMTTAASTMISGDSTVTTGALLYILMTFFQCFINAILRVQARPLCPQAI